MSEANTYDGPAIFREIEPAEMALARAEHECDEAEQAWRELINRDTDYGRLPATERGARLTELAHKDLERAFERRAAAQQRLSQIFAEIDEYRMDAPSYFPQG